MTGQRTAAIRDALIQMIKTHGDNGGGSNACFTATVTGVDIPTRTCTVQGISSQVQMEFTGVLLMPSVSDGSLYVPAKDSIVIIQNNANLQPYVSMFSEVDQILYIVGGATGTEIKMLPDTVVISQDKMAVTLSGGKMKAGNEDADCYDLLKRMITAIEDAMWTGPGGDVTMEPATKQIFEQILTDMGKLFY